MEKLKKWFRKHQRECAGFGVFLVMFVTLTGGVLYYSFVKPPKETKAATEQVVAVTGVKEEAENEETGIGKKSTGTTKDNETETAENDTPNKEQGEKKSEEAEKKDEQEKKQETDQKAGTSNTTEKAATAAASTGNTVVTEQPATTDTGDSAPAASQPESSNAQTSQSDQSPVQETPAQDTPAQETPTQPEPEPEPVWHEPVYEQQWVVDQKAWDETVSDPIYETVEKCICNGCGLDITGNVDSHLEIQMMAGNMACSGYHSEWQTEQVGTNTYTVHHDEVGHYENVLVQEGYWE